MSTVSFFPQHIQRQIEATTAALKHLPEDWFEELNLNTESGIYDGYPYLFLSAFPSLTLSDVQPLARAGRIFAQSLFAYDHMMDGLSSATSALGAQAMQFESYHLLYQLFPPDSPFWKRFRRYMSEYANACLEEQRFAVGERPWREFTQPLAIEIAAAKTGIAKATIAGLTELAGDDSLLEPLIESIHCYYVARQMWDDLHDWKEDLQTGIPSLLLSRLLHERPTQEEWQKASDQLARELYYGGHAQYVLELALDSLDEADDLTADFPQLLWRRALAEMRRQCEALLDDVGRIVRRNLQRVREQPRFTLKLPPAQGRWQQLAWDALRLVVRQWQLGFGEARHIMHLTHAEGFSTSQEYHYGDVFQRALIADAMCDVTPTLNGHLQPVINHELNYLLSRRLTSGVGGWSYFPTVPELAPDADDLGQVMQILLRTGRREQVAEYCEPPLATLLRDNARVDGSFETWIVPATGRTPEQERQADFNQSKWGVGPDNEVMANLLYALALYDATRFDETIQAGISYLEGQQEANGCWMSRWYYGPYYGTYVCLRLLSVARPESPTVSGALRFLRQSQNADGGWGFEETSDPLSASLALLGLASAQDGDSSGDPDRAERALSYLRRSQESDAGWPSVSFIRPRMNAPYTSRTIVNAYVLKAAITWHQSLEETLADKALSADVLEAATLPAPTA